MREYLEKTLETTLWSEVVWKGIFVGADHKPLAIYSQFTAPIAPYSTVYVDFADPRLDAYRQSLQSFRVEIDHVEFGNRLR